MQQEDQLKKKDIRLKDIEDFESEYDFSLYEDESENSEAFESDESDIMKNEARIKGIRSRFSNGQAELDRLATINALVTKYAIRVESRTQDTKDLWQFYGVLNEMWESIRPLFGTDMQKQMIKIKNKCRELLDNCPDGKMPINIYNNLLYYRARLYALRQYANLGYDVEKRTRGYTDRAKENIIQ